VALALAAMSAAAAGPTPPGGITQSAFGKLPDGRTAEIYTLTNRDGMRAGITNYGGILVSLKVPDRQGRMADVVLGYDSLAGYVHDTATYFGALVGRYANRIARGHFQLDGHRYTLPINNPPNSLHGGTEGFSRRLWTATIVKGTDGPAIELSLVSKDGDQGYPGTVHARVIYTLEDDNALRIEYFATTDRDTVVNLTNHAYFNLSGEGSGSMLGTELTIHAHRYTPIDKTLIPIGALAPVAGTPLDFTRATPIGERIGADNPQLHFAGGYDFNYVLDSGGGAAPALAAEAYDPKSRRRMRVYTTQPGLQFYSGNFLNGSPGKQGHKYERRSGFALETQHFPDSPNHANFPSTELKPGQTYHQVTIYRFAEPVRG